ncbi:MAG TPA: sulfotransferase [Gaiellaceae bacterium]|nr:sulfotransferase [Gaiellaceae bacterium]
MRLPDFLFIGADRSGSTWLFRVLRAHPQCFVPPAKDLYYFDRFYRRGLDWYAAFFREAPASAVAGELSHDYLYSPEAADRIASVLPDARLLVFLRHPVDRAFSEYLFLVRSGLVRSGELRRTLAENPDPVEHSRYARYLHAYLDRFPRERVGVFLYDELQQDPAAFARRVFEFLGVGFVDGLPYGERALGAARPRSRVIARGVKAAATVTRGAGFPTLVGRVKSSPVARLLYVQYPEAERPRLSPEDRAWLHAQLDPELPRLEEMLGRSLAHWAAGS